jgi:hypothetical protein
MGWKGSLEQGARDGGHLEPNESLQAAIVADSGRPIGGGAPEAQERFSPFKTRFALIATERNLYLMKMGVMGYKAIDEVVLKIPIGEAEVKSEALGGMVKVGRRGEKPQWDLKLSGLRNRPKKVISYIEAHAGSAA